MSNRSRATREDTASLRTAARGADAVVLTRGSGGDPRPDAQERIDHGGLRNLLTALDGARPRITLMTSLHATRGDVPGHTPWKRRCERLLRASGLPNTIVRPGWFDQAAPTRRRLVLHQGGRAGGAISSDQLAETLVRTLLTDTTLNATFELIAAEGEDPSPSDWTDLFAPLRSDTSGNPDGLLDPDDLPLEAEPARGLADFDAIRP
ncbi:NAD(P)H-binding protein [Streptomyces sp. NPDC056568]|uniref:NAD(P)H-binding protein n=1 Tax=Streptomyces sp. NPDC056568 TaxID=3345866 RepID=UPI0036C4DE08